MTELKAGSDLDREVATQVMGLVPCQGKFCTSDTCYAQPDSPDMGGELRDYSTNIESAWLVVEKLANLDFRLEKESYRSAWYVKFTKPLNRTPRFFYAYGKTAPEAICLAALKSIGAAVSQGSPK